MSKVAWLAKKRKKDQIVNLALQSLTSLLKVLVLSIIARLSESS